MKRLFLLHECDGLFDLVEVEVLFGEDEEVELMEIAVEAIIHLVHLDFENAFQREGPVSGAVVFAKTSKALSRMTVKVKDRDFHKTYLALVKNHPPKMSDELQDYLVKNEKMNKSFVVPEGTKEAKLARLSYRVIGKSDTFYLLEVELFTGRHHQIRCQLAHMGCPIRGDLKYGYPRSNPDASISLHAWRIVFEHPVTKESIEITAPVPEVAPWTAFEAIR